ncbi:acyl-CoA N-acyltransferase [Nemania sp. FL0916]|nr:acyl-CoA N-acyltransferase [Nemania sp. FL0916]
MAVPFDRPASLDRCFTISRPTEADVDALAAVYYDAFVMDSGNTWWWPPEYDAMLDWLRAHIRAKMSDRHTRHFQIRDESHHGAGAVVAFVRWDIPEGYEAQFGEWAGSEAKAPNRSRNSDGAKKGEEEDEKEKEKDDNGPPAMLPSPRGVDPELCRAFFAVLAQLSKKWDAEKMLGLSVLCTSPTYYRRGAARALLVPMLAIADAEGLSSYVEATPAGRPLYEQLGFRTVEVKTLGPEMFAKGEVTRTGSTTLSIMIRKPQLPHS